MLDIRTMANGMSALYIILILSNTHFVSLSFILIKDRIAKNIPPKPLKPANLLMDLYILSNTILEKSQWYFFYTLDYSFQTKVIELSEL